MVNLIWLSMATQIHQILTKYTGCHWMEQIYLSDVRSAKRSSPIPMPSHKLNPPKKYIAGLQILIFINI